MGIYSMAMNGVLLAHTFVYSDLKYTTVTRDFFSNSGGTARQPLLPKRLQQRKNSLDNKRGQSEIHVGTQRKNSSKIQCKACQLVHNSSRIIQIAKLVACLKFGVIPDTMGFNGLYFVADDREPIRQSVQAWPDTRDDTATHIRGVY